MVHTISFKSYGLKQTYVSQVDKKANKTEQKS